jgi:hypothetical protein
MLCGRFGNLDHGESVARDETQVIQGVAPELPGFAAVGIGAELCYDMFTNKHGSLTHGLERSA